jgi:F0F1-type ATP synthase membrane subunit b/b'
VKQGKQDLSDSEKQTAEARAEIDKQAALKEAKEKSDAELQMQQAEIAKQTKQDLSDSEKRTADALAALARSPQSRKRNADWLSRSPGASSFDPPSRPCCPPRR